jgi:universal stress protein A
MKLFRRILVPHDFSDHATRALEVAAELARDHGGRLLVLHVIVPLNPMTTLPEEGVPWADGVTLVTIERRRLETLVRRALGGRETPPRACRVVVGDPFRAIIAAALGADSIVMATAGRTGLSHLLIGSVAEKVVRHAPVPVLTLRPDTTVRTLRARRRVTRARKL